MDANVLSTQVNCVQSTFLAKLVAIFWYYRVTNIQSFEFIILVITICEEGGGGELLVLIRPLKVYEI